MLALVLLLKLLRAHLKTAGLSILARVLLLEMLCALLGGRLLALVGDDNPGGVS